MQTLRAPLTRDLSPSSSCHDARGGRVIAIPGIAVRATRLRGGIDIAIALLLLIVTSPLLLLIGVAIKLSSRGPVIFRQIRVGHGGTCFELLKFRTMVSHADTLKPSLAPYNEMDGPVFKMSRDPRVTAWGRWLRKSSLDELPQLWNIVRGEMTFVGPRPMLVEEVLRLEPAHCRRFLVRPGLTCLWQTNGRNELSFEEWMRLDILYVNTQSLWLDLKIALNTIPAVLSRRGAN